MDQKITAIVRSLATQVLDAKVIADRLGIESNSLFESQSEDVAQDVAIHTPSFVQELQDKITELQSTIADLRSHLSTPLDNTPEFSDVVLKTVLDTISKSLSDLNRSQITKYYDSSYFQKCHPKLQPIVAQALVSEFEKRKIAIPDLWAAHL